MRSSLLNGSYTRPQFSPILKNKHPSAFLSRLTERTCVKCAKSNELFAPFQYKKAQEYKIISLKLTDYLRMNNCLL